jgi:hypothetical protein
MNASPGGGEIGSAALTTVELLALLVAQPAAPATPSERAINCERRGQYRPSAAASGRAGPCAAAVVRGE